MFCVLSQLAIPEQITVNLHKSLIVALSFNFARHRQLKQHAVTGWPSFLRVAVCLVNIGFMCHCLLCLLGGWRYIFIFFEALENFLKTIFVCVGKASSFAIFGLCVGLCELQMCLLLGMAFLWFHKN